VTSSKILPTKSSSLELFSLFSFDPKYPTRFKQIRKKFAANARKWCSAFVNLSCKIFSISFSLFLFLNLFFEKYSLNIATINYNNHHLGIRYCGRYGLDKFNTSFYLTTLEKKNIIIPCLSHFKNALIFLYLYFL